MRMTRQREYHQICIEIQILALTQFDYTKPKNHCHASAPKGSLREKPASIARGKPKIWMPVPKGSLRDFRRNDVKSETEPLLKFFQSYYAWYAASEAYYFFFSYFVDNKP